MVFGGEVDCWRAFLKCGAFLLQSRAPACQAQLFETAAVRANAVAAPRKRPQLQYSTVQYSICNGAACSRAHRQEKSRTTVLICRIRAFSTSLSKQGPYNRTQYCTELKLTAEECGRRRRDGEAPLHRLSRSGTWRSGEAVRCRYSTK